MFEGYKERHNARLKYASITLVACVVIVKIVMRVIALEPAHDAYADPVPAPVVTAPELPHVEPKLAFPGFALASSLPLSPVGNYAQGHVDSDRVTVNWKIEPFENRAASVELQAGVLHATVSERDAAVTLGGQPAVRTTLKIDTATRLAYYIECDDRLVELVVRDDAEGKKLVDSFRCTPDATAKAAVDQPHVIVEPSAGWAPSAHGAGQVALYRAQDDTALIAHGIPARDVAIRTAVAQYFDGTMTELDGNVVQRGDKYIFGARNKDGTPTKVVAWRCSPDEAGMVLLLAPIRRSLDTALPLALSGRCA